MENENLCAHGSNQSSLLPQPPRAEPPRCGHLPDPSRPPLTATRCPGTEITPRSHPGTGKELGPPGSRASPRGCSLLSDEIRQGTAGPLSAPAVSLPLNVAPTRDLRLCHRIGSGRNNHFKIIAVTEGSWPPRVTCHVPFDWEAGNTPATANTAVQPWFAFSIPQNGSKDDFQSVAY